MNINVLPRASEELQKAVEARRQESETATAVRVMIGHSCGCGNAKFQMGFDDPEEGDNRIEVNGVTLLVDPTAAPLLEGAELDYSDDLMSAGFLINAPNASTGGGCGCGGHGHSHEHDHGHAHAGHDHDHDHQHTY